MQSYVNVGFTNLNFPRGAQPVRGVVAGAAAVHILRHRDGAHLSAEEGWQALPLLRVPQRN